MRAQLNLIPIALALFTAAASAQSVYTVNEGGQFGTVNLSSGTFAPIGPGLPEGTDGLVFTSGGNLLTIGGDGELYSINPSTGVATGIGNTGMGTSTAPVNSLGGANGMVYALDANNTLYSINPTTAAAALIGSTGMPSDPGCGNYPNLCDEALFASNGKLYATYDAWLVGADGYSTTVTVNPALWQIDPSTGVATFVSSTDIRILSLTDDAGEIVGFEGFPSAANPLPNPLIEAINFDVANGDTSEIVSLGTGTGPMFGVAPDIAATPEPTSLAFLGTGLVAIAVRLRAVKLARSNPQPKPR